MAKRRTEPVRVPETPLYYTWDEGDKDGKALAMRASAEAVKQSQPVVRTSGSNLWSNVVTNTSVRDSFDRQDYEYFRPGERMGRRPKEVIKQAMDAYQTNGLVSNIIDLIGDFVVQGIDIVHPNQRIDKFYKTWFHTIVKAKDRSERIANLLPRAGTCVVKRQTAKLKPKDEESLRRGTAADIPTDVDSVKVIPREIPWRYTVLSPLSLEVMGEELVPFLGPDSYSFAVQVPEKLAKTVRDPQLAVDKELVSKLPSDIRKAIQSGNRYIPIEPGKVQPLFYKKDDWSVWGKPMIAPVLKDIMLLEKMKLADLSALDGAISNIRVWKLGSLEHRIMPSKVAISRLAEMLTNNVGGGVMDLIWTADIDLIETSTDVHQFLGDTKYGPVLTAIYAGLGIPPTLTGASTASGFTNNYISIKTLTERLQYIRDILIGFWNVEIRIVQKAMGFRFPAQVTFDRMVLTDEASELALLIQLFDRLGISQESLQDRFGLIPDIEKVRIRREHAARQQGTVPPKAGPFHDGQPDLTLKKQFVQQGTIAPSQVGLNLPDKKPGEETPTEHHVSTAPTPEKKQGPMPGPGRPTNSKDKKKRKQKAVKPRTKASVFMKCQAWALDAQGIIAKLVSPAYLKAISKGNLRQLTTQEAKDFEAFKFALLCTFDIGQAIDQKSVGKLLQQKLSVPKQVAELMKVTVSKHVEQKGEEPSLDTIRLYQAGAFAMWKGDYGA